VANTGKELADISPFRQLKLQDWLLHADILVVEASDSLRKTMM
jgi:hypothetical protein